MFEQRFDTVLDLFNGTDFPTWKEKIISDLKGKVFEDLITLTEDGIEMLPIYTAETTKDYILNIPTRKTQDWQITEYITVENCEKANQEALNALQNGANTILFNFKNNAFNQEQIAILVKDFLLDAITIYAKNIGNTSVHLLSEYSINYNPKIFVPQQKSTVNELLFAVHYLFQNEAEISNVHFNIGQNYFLEIAKIRAFRWLVAQINQLQIKNKQFVLFSETGFENRNDDFIENNILRNTTEAMSAILGGCDALIIHPHENSNLGRRIARNIHHLLYYESNFKQIPDVVKGTYYIEYLTYQLAKKTWEQLN
ncbi:MAG TPA: methylmalonyl-CoA mutase family protein [Chitinophagales bacterium]|nr:hypothetical protein [Chitinophagales bacterium]HMU97201.1 methylmalonyl-CoA mutase family protein [Chitinophagales bacterium]HMV02417.1 methylmalonyl-CoA mutase family protein [Chitinophagales bacterium]HMW94001.1 methylmalonyl-CoA mutase family protein [Chitinophagales bacterium]HMY41789.1 methylmalonyl-CoA mutase family protein [Chitinophagales bacterium]